MNHTIVHVEIPAKDRHAAVKFFQDLFGWGEARHMDEYMYTTTYSGNSGVGFSDTSDTRQPGSVVFYVETNDLDGDIKAAEANGGKLMVEKMPIPGGHIAWIADPSGNSIGVMQRDGTLPEDPKPSGRPFVHVEIPAKDRDAQAKFYQKLFGWKFQHMDEPAPYTTFESENFGGGYPDVGDMYKPGDIIVYIDSDDLQADVNKIKAAGGSTMGDVMEVPGFGSLIFFGDPTGNRLALWQAAM